MGKQEHEQRDLENGEIIDMYGCLPNNDDNDIQVRSLENAMR